jgi:oligoendopeptidase F
MSKELRNRNEVPLEDRWVVESIYGSDEEWEKDFCITDAFADSFRKWTGRLSESPDTLKSAVEELLSQNRLISKLSTYTEMKRDEDLSNSHYSGLSAKISSRTVLVRTAHSFFTPELLSIYQNTIESWLVTPELAPYRIWLENILRYRPHTLSDKEEKLIAMSGEITRGFSTVFGKLNNVDMPARLPEIVDSEGYPVKLTHGNFAAFLQNKDRRVRKDAFKGFYSEISGNISTQAALLEGQVRTNIFYAKVQKHNSALVSSLFNDKVSTEVYDSLIDSVHNNFPTLYRYLDLRKKVLGFDSMHLYDVQIPIVPESKGEYTWDEAIDLTLEAVAPLGSYYVNTLKKGFEDRWADKYENKGKRSGAYSGGCYDSYPYILHNFNGTLRSVFTLAHEAGHSMHSLLSKNTQPYHMSSYKIILAEVASTTNEMLLVDLLLKRTKDRDERAYLLDHLLSKFKSTLIRQTMFAEFEKYIHEHVEAGGSLTPDYLNEAYLKLVKLYHGNSFAFDDTDSVIAYEWSRIPHFYYNFYVYKYATGLASAVDISSRIISGEKGAVENFIDFLKGGSSKAPLDLLKGTGVDLSTPVPVNAALQVMDSTLTELEGLLTVE